MKYIDCFLRFKLCSNHEVIITKTINFFQNFEGAADENIENRQIDPQWLEVVMDLYKILFVLNCSVNYYLYLIKLVIVQGECNMNRIWSHQEQNSEEIQIQELLSNHTQEIEKNPQQLKTSETIVT